ncbi:SEC-C domain-containing protein [Oceanobacillus sp. Castelsardo]|uniref:SEC-C domain-containing protein n=1 Tax=Oceanobacillus sp. Castelsardo TaxID=1851204 RepID=UPI000838EC18|nr:SEC-C domain-containing protein [Oceanobacillus sp. Castelsardo]
MSKIRRNDPCPCGSGKKYKKCCGASNVIAFSPDLYNLELDKLHTELINFTKFRNQDAFIEAVSDYHQPFIKDNDERSDIYIKGISLWTVFNVPFLKNKQTVFNAFYEKQKSNIKYKKVEETFSKWTQYEPGVFEIMSKNEQENKITLRNVVSDELFHIAYRNAEILNEGYLAVGILVPYIQKHEFFSTMVLLGDSKKNQIIDVTSQYIEKYGSLVQHYPDFLAEILTLDDQEENEILEWSNPLHEQVALEFTNHMLKKNIEEKYTDIGEKLWNVYCKNENPNFKKVSGYAAALDYLVQNTILENEVTQSEIAKEYETSATTISSNFRKLQTALDEEIQQVMKELK